MWDWLNMLNHKSIWSSRNPLIYTDINGGMWDVKCKMWGDKTVNFEFLINQKCLNNLLVYSCLKDLIMSCNGFSDWLNMLNHKSIENSRILQFLRTIYGLQLQRSNVLHIRSSKLSWHLRLSEYVKASINWAHRFHGFTQKFHRFFDQFLD